MTELETQIWNTVHNWCDAQSNEIPDQNRRYLMDEIKALVLSHVSTRTFKVGDMVQWRGMDLVVVEVGIGVILIATSENVEDDNYNEWLVDTQYVR